MRILGIESSCDETAAAVVTDGTEVITNVVASSHEMHEKYGGIVPEVAARMQLSSINPAITEALLPFGESNDTLLARITNHIDAIAVTVGPGLIGSLLVGVETAKTIAMVTKKPIIPVNHVLAHMYANFINPNQNGDNNKTTIREKSEIRFPAISLVVSGGHTELYLMESPKKLTWLGGTIDDAAGECFDKTARLLGFGHGGGVAIQNAALKSRIQFRVTDHSSHLPRPMLDKENALNFSFSGLKTAILRYTQKLQSSGHWNDEAIADLSYEVQEAITDVLVKKTFNAMQEYNAHSLLLSGGVSANARLREKFSMKIQQTNMPVTLHAPPVPLCTDNAVYIASYAHFRGTPVAWEEINAFPDLSVEVHP